MSIRAAFAAAVFILPLPASAQEQPAVDLVAKFLIGAADGASFILDIDYSIVPLTQSGPGSFGGPTENGDFAVTVAQSDQSCVFDITLTYWQGTRSTRVTFDANQLAAIDYTVEGILEFDPPVTTYLLQFSGGERLLTLPEQTGADGRPQAGQNAVQVMTSVPQGELEAALAHFRADHCPGIAS